MATKGDRMLPWEAIVNILNTAELDSDAFRQAWDDALEIDTSEVPDGELPGSLLADRLLGPGWRLGKYGECAVSKDGKRTLDYVSHDYPTLRATIPGDLP